MKTSCGGAAVRSYWPMRVYEPLAALFALEIADALLRVE
jgi:hypothetical protein